MSLLSRRLRIDFPWSSEVRSWKKFGRRVRGPGRQLLQRLTNFAHPVLVAGCQRSGTTALSRVIANSDSFRKYEFTHDDELDAALILAGRLDVAKSGRYCFQTTYLNENYAEYFALPKDARLIWVIRNPGSVVYSMVYNWRRFALNELFESCGKAAVEKNGNGLVDQRRRGALSPIEKACWSYVGKSQQLFEISRHVGSEQLLVVDYDQLCANPDTVLRQVFEFIDEPYATTYGDGINRDSVSKVERLSESEVMSTNDICVPLFDAMRELAISS